MLSMLLEASGHTVIVEYDARRALLRAQAQRLDLCLLGIGLPEMDGTALAHALRQLSATANATVFAITGYGQESDRNRTAAAGFDHHPVKPVEMEKLFSILRQIASADRIGLANRARHGDWRT